MTSLRILLVAAALGLSALPALAGGIPFDLPRLDFPAPKPDVSRDCPLPAVPQAPLDCAARGR